MSVSFFSPRTQKQLSRALTGWSRYCSLVDRARVAAADFVLGGPPQALSAASLTRSEASRVIDARGPSCAVTLAALRPPWSAVRFNAWLSARSVNGPGTGPAHPWV